MIKAIIGQNDGVTFFRNDGSIEKCQLSYDEWRFLSGWLQNAIYSNPPCKPTWVCNPLYSHPGGFVAQKLIVF